MFKNAQPLSPMRTPMTIAALSILLAACGGGGGGDSSANSTANSTASSSANATSNTTINVGGNAANTPAPSGTAGGASAGNTGSTANTGAATPATETPRNTTDASGTTVAAPSGTTTASGPVAPISTRGVRGDVLLGMMDQNGCTTPYTLRTASLFGETITGQNGADTVELLDNASFDNVNSYTDDMSKWQGAVPASAPAWFVCTQPGVRSYTKPIAPGSYTYTSSSRPSYFFLGSSAYGQPWLKKGVRQFTAIYTVNITDDSLSIGSSVKVNQQEDFGYMAASQRAHAAMTQRVVEADFTAEAYSVKRDALVPFGTLREWRDGAGNRVSLMVIAGDTPDEARVCTDTNTDMIKRLQCKSWRVPADWSWGKPLNDPKQYIIDDRSVYSGETGHMYWSKQMTH